MHATIAEAFAPLPHITEPKWWTGLGVHECDMILIDF